MSDNLEIAPAAESFIRSLAIRHTFQNRKVQLRAQRLEEEGRTALSRRYIDWVTQLTYSHMIEKLKEDLYVDERETTKVVIDTDGSSPRYEWLLGPDGFEPERTGPDVTHFVTRIEPIDDVSLPVRERN